MTTKKTISPLVMGALTLTMGMSLVNNANATLIAGSSNGATVTATDISINVENTSEFSYDIVYDDESGYENGTYGEDSAFIELANGEYNSGFEVYVEEGIYSYGYQNESYSESESGIYDFSALSASWGITFSVNDCNTGEENYTTSCINKLDADTVIDADWFNGTLGYGHGWGYLYEEYSGTYSNSGEDGEDAEEGLFDSHIGNWGEVGDSGYVAFAFVSDYDGSGNIWENEYVQYGWFDVTRGSISINNVAVQSLTSVPEPTSLLLLGAGLFGLVARKKVKRSTS